MTSDSSERSRLISPGGTARKCIGCGPDGFVNLCLPLDCQFLFGSLATWGAQCASYQGSHSMITANCENEVQEDIKEEYAK